MKELSRKLGEMEHDGLVTGINPKVRIDGGTIAALGTAATYKRGTLLGKDDATGKLSLYDGATTPDCILCDETEIGTTEDVVVAAYMAGCFNPDKVIVADSYTLTEADKDKLRERGIVFKAASPAL